MAGLETQLPGTQLRTRITVHARMIANTAHINMRSRSELAFTALAIIRYSGRRLCCCLQGKIGGFVPNRTVGWGIIETVRSCSSEEPGNDADVPEYDTGENHIGPLQNPRFV